MYSRPLSVETDPGRLHALIAAHPLATVAGLVAGSLEVTLVPLLARREAGATVLVGHVAADNPLIHARAVTAVFRGPHAFISASWYADDNLVPTWNYQVVEARGQLEVLSDDHQAVQLLAALADHLEGRAASQWQQRLSADQAARLRAGIVCFRIVLSHLQGVFKLSQHHPTDRRRRVISALRARAQGDDLAVAEAMERSLEDPAA